MTGKRTRQKIERLRVHVVDIPVQAVHSHGSGDISGVTSAILEIVTDGGLTGWGEASPWPVFTGTVEANAAALHVHLRPHLLGEDPVQVERHMAMADRVVVGCPEAKAALEAALLDITGQVSGLSVSELVAAATATGCRSAFPSPIPTSTPISTTSPALPETACAS